MKIPRGGREVLAVADRAEYEGRPAARNQGPREEAPLMAGTKQFITGSVGVGGRNASVDVRALQQLLIAAGTEVKGGADGGWGVASDISL